eukprot:CAMPEP_0181315160 /NCGR_PEP_ID=MMETSP1101-20121128/15218_1 /TAXON_ID=46948 /ORGANISM="Rhodomonas abbreviata, Strain Caron Lab Isolate" /LENGTH=118 /DNA_ID=CAMNT_0023422331 /DNA_START=126 /DNA_END=482 /DNA_ORIENTATION=-
MSVLCVMCAGVCTWALSVSVAAYAAREADHARRCVVGTALIAWAMMVLSLVVIQTWTASSLSPTTAMLAAGITSITVGFGLFAVVIEAMVVVLRKHGQQAGTAALPQFGASGWLTERL